MHMDVALLCSIMYIYNLLKYVTVNLYHHNLHTNKLDFPKFIVKETGNFKTGNCYFLLNSSELHNKTSNFLLSIKVIDLWAWKYT